jgi:acyl-CoA thioester hydrolase
MLRANGSAYFVTRVDIRYRRPARLGDDVQVVSSVEQVRASSVHIHQRVMRGDELLADASVTAAFLDREGRPRRQPRDWVEIFREIGLKGQ